MFRISRELHCALAGTEFELLKTLERRGQAPSFPRGSRNGFTPLATLGLALFEAMAREWHVHRTYAAGICTAGAPLLVERWRDIRDTSETFDRDILFGRVLSSGPRILPACGPLDEIARDHPGASSALLISASRVAATIRARARRLDLDLEGFWAQPESTEGFWAEPPTSISAPRRPPKPENEQG
jgi:hypothetical protein